MTPTALTMRYLRRSGYLVDVGIQATSLSNVSARLAKACACPALAVWLRTGAKFQVIGWNKVRGVWHPKVVELTGEDMAATVLSRPPRRGRSRHEPGDLFSDLGEGAA